MLGFAEIGDDLSGLDVILLDLYLTGHVPSWGFIKELAVYVPILVMSASRHRDDVVQAIRSGAAGYLTKDAEHEEFTAAVRTVSAGEFFLSPELADIVNEALAEGSAEPELSAREEEALSLIASGFTHAQTARRMGISKATVDTYVERIRRKLQVGNKAELTRAALRRRRGSPYRGNPRSWRWV